MTLGEFQTSYRPPVVDAQRQYDVIVYDRVTGQVVYRDSLGADPAKGREYVYRREISTWFFREKTSTFVVYVR